MSNNLLRVELVFSEMYVISTEKRHTCKRLSIKSIASRVVDFSNANWKVYIFLTASCASSDLKGSWNWKTKSIETT